MDYSVFDIEADELLEKVTKIHCMSVKQYRNGEVREFSLTDYNDIANYILSEPILVGHNIIRYDIPVLEKILGIEYLGRQIDTLGITWYLYPNMLKPGLESWGEIFGIPKPVIVDWKNLSIEEYIHRCEEDVKINDMLFNMQIKYLKEIYVGQNINDIMGYITFKLKCAREQEEVMWKGDLDKINESLVILYKEREIKTEALRSAMPPAIKYRVAKYPAKAEKKDGELSATGAKWFYLLGQMGLPIDHTEDFKVPIGEEPGNPQSHVQLKNWLFSLGWEPATYKYEKDKINGTIRKIPQISLIDGSDICGSVKLLYEKEPVLVNLELFYKILHRISILEGFLENMDENCMLKAEISGFTNTMRFKHSILVNLPTIHKAYGDLVRGSLIAPTEEHLLCGSDMSSLEDSTKQHYMFYFDPEYVAEMQVPGFSPHLDIGVQGEMITKEESDFYIWYDAVHSNDKVVSDMYFPKVTEKYLSMTEEEQKTAFKAIGKVRKDSKQVNFSAVYGVGAPKMSLTTGWPQSKSKALLDIYWVRNWAVKKVASSVRSKTINGQMWLYNPISHFWYSLRAEKDKFSTLNQGTGVYCFDTWVRNVRKRGIKICGQFHDEIVAPLHKTQKEHYEKSLREAINEVNEELKLNVKLGISIDFGYTYAEIH